MVRYSGEVLIEFSRDIPDELRREIGDILDMLNSDILRRGAREGEEARIVGCNVVGKAILMRVTAGRKVPPHVAALRIKNYFEKKIGPRHKLGVRDVMLKNAVIELSGEHTVKLEVPIIERIDVGEGKTQIFLKDLDEGMLKKPILQRLVLLVEEKEQRKLWGGKIEHWVKIRESARKQLQYEKDPNIVLEEIGWMKNIAPGQWLHTPPLAYIIRRFEDLFIDVVLKPVGFLEAIFPKMEPLDIGLKTGHLKGTPNQMIFACLPISYNIEEFEEWQDYISIFGNPDPNLLKKFLEPPNYYMCFAQCPPFYRFLSKTIFTDKNLPVKWFDKSGPSFRWEGTGGLRGLERLVEFHRIEVVWLGTKEQVIDIRNALLERYEYFMDKVLDLEWRWAWVTPWFLVHAGETKEMEEKVDIDQPGTIDFEAYLPYKGPRDNPKSWLEIGNISIHGAKYTKVFKIKHAAGKVLCTGCSGFGVERWVLAFLAQKGFDRKEWPPLVREYIEKVPKGLEASNYPKPHHIDLKRRIEELLAE